MKYTASVLLTVLILSGCASIKKTLQKGDYYGAAIEAVKQLRSNPNNKNAQEVLQVAYPLAVENGLRKINNAMMAGMPDKNMTAADEYIALNQIADAIYTSPKALELIPKPEQFNRELGSVLPLAAEEAYNFGDSYLSYQTIQGAQEAYNYFLKADRYVNGYRDVKSKIEATLYLATCKVVVTRPKLPLKYQLTADFFYNNLMSKLSQIAGNKFLRFYSEEEATSERLQTPDQYLVLDFEDFVVGNISETKNSVQLSRDSVLVGTTTVNGKPQNVYGTVKATFEVYRREVTAQGSLSVRVILAANNRVEAHRSLPSKYVWVNEWATYKGDERALTDKEKRMSNAKPMNPPPQQELFVEFAKSIFDQTVSFVRNHYSKYK